MGIDIDALEALAKAAPSGTWETWTSCSWRRIMADDGNATRRVIEPTYHPGDNWPDLLFGEGVREFIEAAQPSVILMLIDELRLLRATVDASAAERRRLDSGCLVLQERDEFGEAYRCEDRGLNLRAANDAAQRDSTLHASVDCWCETCRPVTLSDMRMVLCPDCGNKRCPRATNHRNLCTNSNEAGQPGSSWEGVKPIGARKRDTEPQGPA